MDTTKVIVSRRWTSEAPIEAYLTDREIGARIELKDFILALADEMSDIGVDRPVVKVSLQKAAEKVLSEMKSKTRYVVR